MPPKKKGQKREENEDSDDNVQRLMLVEAKLDSLASTLKSDKAKRSKKSKKKRDRKSSSSSSSSSSTDKSSKSSKSSNDSSSDMEDQEITIWRPKKWLSGQALRGQLDNFFLKVEARHPPVHLLHEAQFLKEIALLADRCSKNTKLKAAIGRRIVVTLTKSEFRGPYEQVEEEMKAQLLGKGSKQWATAKAKTLKKFREVKKFTKGKIFRKPRFKFRDGTRTGRKNPSQAGQ